MFQAVNICQGQSLVTNRLIRPRFSIIAAQVRGTCDSTLPDLHIFNYCAIIVLSTRKGGGHEMDGHRIGGQLGVGKHPRRHRHRHSLEA